MNFGDPSDQEGDPKFKLVLVIKTPNKNSYDK